MSKRTGSPVVETVSHLAIYPPQQPEHPDLSPHQPPARRQSKKTEELVSNHYAVDVEEGKTIYPYGLSVEAHAGEKIFSLSKGPKDDGSRILRAGACRSALAIALKKHDLLKKGQYMASDGFSVALSNVDLSKKLEQERFPLHSHVLTIATDDLPAGDRKAVLLPDTTEIRIRLTQGEHAPFNTTEFTKILSSGAGLADKDSSILRYLEIITNDLVLMKYVGFGGGRFFPRDPVGSGHGKGGQMKVLGIEKGIGSVTEGDQSLPSIIMDVKTGVFFKSQPLLDSIRELAGRSPRQDRNPVDFEGETWRLMDKYINGIRLTMNHEGRELSFLASGISDQKSGDIAKELTGVFSNLFDRLSQYSHWPAVRVFKKVDNQYETAYYPIEKCVIVKNQRVPKSKQGNPPAPMPVDKRFGDIQNLMKKIYFDGGKATMKAFGLNIREQPVDVTAICRPLPQPVYADGAKPAVDVKGGWRIGNSRFVEAAHIDNIVVAYDCDKVLAESMADVLKQALKKHGIEAKWAIFTVAHLDEASEKVKLLFERVVAQQKAKKCGESVLLMYLDSKIENPTSHKYLKYFERIHLMATQQVTTEVAEKLKGSRDTAQNILNKMNVKMGGINYTIIPENILKREWIDDGKTFIMGYDVSHPTGLPMDKRAPTVASTIGFSFNGAKNPQSFVGDFHYQLPREEQVNHEIMVERVCWMLKRFGKHRDLPENIVVLRDGVSTGQFAMVISEEFESIKEGVELYKKSVGKKAKDWKPKYLVVIITKRHNKRFCVAGEKGIANPMPGIAIDDTICRTDVTHFIMQSHNIIKSTGKLPQYYVHVNELRQDDKETQDKLQSLMMALAFHHQIYHGGLSIPEPVYQADLYATRGKDLWDTFEELEAEFPRMATWNKAVYDTAPIDYEEMSNRLSYKDTPLEQFRVNA